MDPLSPAEAARATKLPQTVRLADGRTFTLRRLAIDDVAALRRAFHRLTPEEVELRFMHQSRNLPDFIEHEVRALDPAHDAAFVLEESGEIRAVADLHTARSGAREAEFGLIVGRAIAGLGFGTLLLQRLMAEARTRGVDLVGLVRRDNGRMLDLCRTLGGDVHNDADDMSLLRVRFRDRTPPARVGKPPC